MQKQISPAKEMCIGEKKKDKVKYVKIYIYQYRTNADDGGGRRKDEVKSQHTVHPQQWK